MSEKYTADYFLEKFLKIPDDEWAVGEYESKDGCRHCALGHCGARESGPNKKGDYDDHQSLESHKLIQLFAVNLNSPFTVGGINDAPSTAFPQETPKQRILAALRYIKEKQCQSP